jgi:ascorbate-specific PTS system EIIC-type component UlaA
MRALYERMVAATAVLFVAFTVAQVAPTALLVTSIAAIAIASLVAVRYAAAVTGSRELAVGHRAHAHRETLSAMPAPSHPCTAGRPRTRAPSQAASAA